MANAKKISKPTKSSADTPVMRQYLELKSQHPDALLFFRLGDFYEMFFEDAVTAARALDLTLTSRDKKKENGVPMCGVPHHAAKTYLARLIDQGFKVAVCEQMEDPKLAKGPVKRAITEVITPGVVVDADQLDASANNYLVALYHLPKTKKWGLAAFDLSTTELKTTEVDIDSLVDELARLSPKEIIYYRRIESKLKELQEIIPSIWQVIDDKEFVEQIGEEEVRRRANVDLAEAGLKEMPNALAASALALAYAEKMRPMCGVPSCRLVVYQSSIRLQIDEPTLRNLEIFLSVERKKKGSLLGVLDQTKTAMGARLLRSELSAPLIDITMIRRRQDAVELFVEEGDIRRDIQECLNDVYDLERLTSRTILGVINPSEMKRLAFSIDGLAKLFHHLQRAKKRVLGHQLPELIDWPDDVLSDLEKLLNRALSADAPTHTRDGGIFARGYSKPLNELIDLCEGGKTSILNMEAELRESTGISTLKVRYNKVFGYFIEIRKSNVHLVPKEFVRKQTLVNAERYVTDELADYEAKVLSAQDKRIALEQELYEKLIAKVKTFAPRLNAAAQRIALLDMVIGFAQIAQDANYCRPTVDDSHLLTIHAGRHPVVEAALGQAQFVPNDLHIDRQSSRMIILTGPNMSGKSTIMRQVALITLMAQVGAFVPAKKVRLGVVDRVFTRVGASDNLSRGESTFMVEMKETSNILKHATNRSLVVLDEIGRGTATYDGISIAWAVAEFLHDQIKCRTLFATHYHELCQISDVKPYAKNFSVAVKEWQGKVVFLRTLVEGATSRSYGIEVARLAGLPKKLIARSNKILAALEGGEIIEDVPLRGRFADDANDQLKLFEKKSLPRDDSKATHLETHPVIETLKTIKIDHLRPLDALNLLADLKEKTQN